MGCKIISELRINLGFMERLHVLLGSSIDVRIVTETERDPGTTYSTSTTRVAESCDRSARILSNRVPSEDAA